MSKKLSKEILKHSVLAGFALAFLFIFPLLIDKNAMSPIYTDISCADIDGDGVLNVYDYDIDGDNIINDDDLDVDGNGENDLENFFLEDCEIERMPLLYYYPYFLILFGPVLSVFLYRRKINILINF